MLHFHILMVVSLLNGQPYALLHSVPDPAYEDRAMCETTAPWAIRNLQAAIAADERFAGKYNVTSWRCYTDSEIDHIRAKWPMLLPLDIVARHT
jgi:hypothetical protein